MCFHEENNNRICDNAVYVDDFNIIGSKKEIKKASDYLK